MGINNFFLGKIASLEKSDSNPADCSFKSGIIVIDDAEPYHIESGYKNYLQRLQTTWLNEPLYMPTGEREYCQNVETADIDGLLELVNGEENRSVLNDLASVIILKKASYGLADVQEDIDGVMKMLPFEKGDEAAAITDILESFMRDIEPQHNLYQYGQNIFEFNQ